MKLLIEGPVQLEGTVQVQASKNAGQKIIPAVAALTGKVRLEKCSLVGDNRALLEILESLGAHVDIRGNTVEIDTRTLRSEQIPRNLTMKTTGSFIFAGSLLSRFGEVRIGAPGGDELGARPVDFHLQAFEAMGATVQSIDDGYIITADSISPVDYTFPSKTANGTVNACILALAAKGESVLRNVDVDPDIQDFIDFMNAAGHRIEVLPGDEAIKIRGGDEFSEIDIEHTMITDRNDAVTLLCAAVATRGEVRIEGVPDGIGPAVDLLVHMGARITLSGDTLVVNSSKSLTNVASVITAAFPGLSTDWGPMLQAVMLTADGTVEFTEAVFRYRFSQIEGFQRMGALIEMTASDGLTKHYRFPADEDPHTAVLSGPVALSGARVRGKDIRGAAALVIAALAASGVTELLGAEHVVRGYEDLPSRLRSLGAVVSISS